LIPGVPEAHKHHNASQHVVDPLKLKYRCAEKRITENMPPYAYAIIATGWLAWMMPFLLMKGGSEQANQVDKRARWGIVLVAISYSVLWQSRFWERPPQTWRVAISILFFLIAALLSWTAPRALGRQWRVDAGLNADHQLVTTGPYRFVRHPIYTSMLAVLLGTGFMVTPWWLFSVAFIVFLAGTEIRMRIEDHLLASRFGKSFTAYKSSVAAYIPFVF
jgi:protein-S-isoprenylcysteine O-methyltransferase Ste14